MGKIWEKRRSLVSGQPHNRSGRRQVRQENLAPASPMMWPEPATQRRCMVQTEQMATVDLFDRITVEPGKCGGKPCIRGMRITVRSVLELLATYPDRTALRGEYPFLGPENLQQALRYAAATVDDERLRIDRVA